MTAYLLQEFKGCKFELLASPLDLVTEGAEMHHCVGSYAEQVEAGSYAAYRVVVGPERATVGIRAQGKSWVFDQARGQI